MASQGHLEISHRATESPWPCSTVPNLYLKYRSRLGQLSLFAAHAAKSQRTPGCLAPLSSMSFFSAPEGLSGMLGLGGLCALIMGGAADVTPIMAEATIADKESR